ncbi:MAG: hypothetical protein JNN11_04855 [Candidatus Doudnabacteria bacterium]|nr:hypothetical protein [Candidatus Doudnabacteria bacterium]
MNKKSIIFIVILVVCLSLGVLLFFPKNEEGSSAIENLQNYKIEVREKNQALKSSILINGKLNELKDRTELENYAVVTFNQTNDIMWVLCRQDFEIKSATSPSNNQVYIDTGVGANTELYKDRENTVIIECTNSAKQ